MLGYNWQSKILPFTGIIKIIICKYIHIYNPVQGLPAHPKHGTRGAVPVHTELAHIGGDVDGGPEKVEQYTIMYTCYTSYRIPSMGGTVYLPTWMVDFYGKCREIYHTWILWVYC